MTRVQKNLAFALILLVGGGGAAVYTVRTKVKTPDERFKEEQNKKRLFHFGRAHVKQGRLQTETATFSFAREGTEWMITEPVRWPADTKAIDAMIDRMAAIIAEPLISDDASTEQIERAGLVDPITELHVDLVSDEKLSLLIGPKNKMVDKYPITTGDKKRLGLSESSFYWSMARALHEFRDKRVFPYEAAEIEKIEIKEGAELHIGLEKKEDLWWVEGEGIESAIRADRGSVQVMLVALTKRMKVERFVLDTYAPKSEAEAKFGLSAPELSVTVTTKSGESRTLHIAPKNETNTAEGSAIAFVQGTTSLVALRAGAADALTPPALTFRDRLLSRFSPSAVQKVRIEIAGEAPAVLVKQGDLWRMTAPKNQMAKVWKVDAVVRPFASLRVDGWKTDNATKKNRQEWLLDPWSRRVVIYGAKDAVLADVRIGNLSDEDHVFATTANDSRVGVIPVRKIRAFPQRVQDLLTD